MTASDAFGLSARVRSGWMVIVAALQSVTGMAGDSLDTWHWRNPLPQGHKLTSAVYADGAIVMAGDGPTLIRSSDGGVSWTLLDAGVVPSPNNHVSSIAYGNGRFVAVMDSGPSALFAVSSLLTSTDGINWTTNALSAEYGTVHRVVFAGGQFELLTAELTLPFPGVLVDRYLLTSTNGTNWARLDYDGDFRLEDLLYEGGVYVGVGRGTNDSTKGVIATSSDLNSWQVRRSDVASVLDRVASGDGKFVATGSFVTATSSDGTTWSDYTESIDFVRVELAYGNGIFISLGYRNGLNDSIFNNSVDGTTWSTRQPLVGSTALVYAGDHFVFGGTRGSLRSTTNGYGSTGWSRDVAPFWHVAQVKHGNGRYLALTTDYSGSTEVLRATDGNEWETTGIRLQTDQGLAFGNNTFVAVGNSGAVASSPDGSSWSTTNVPGGDMLKSVAYLNGQFIAVGDAADPVADSPILTSADGQSWTNRTSGTSTSLTGVAYGGGEYLAVGFNVALSSVDGVDWTDVTPPSPFVFVPTRIAYGNGVFVAMGPAGSYVSTNGLDWRSVPTGGYSLVFDGTRFVMGGSTGEIRSSTNGLNWTSHPSGTFQQISDLAVGPNTLVAVGLNGMILESDPFGGVPSTPVLQARLTGTPGEVELLISGSAGQNYELQYSSELPPSWNMLDQILNASELESRVDDSSVDQMRVYRVRVLPTPASGTP